MCHHASPPPAHIRYHSNRKTCIRTNLGITLPQFSSKCLSDSRILHTAHYRGRQTWPFPAGSNSTGSTLPLQNTTAFQWLHLQTAGIWNMSKPGHDASPQCLKPKENWNSSFMLCHEDTCCFDFQRLLFFHLISDLVMWNFHVLWSWISFKGIGYSSFSSPMQNSCSHTLKNLCYLQCLWIRGGFNVNIDTTAISPVFVIHF